MQNLLQNKSNKANWTNWTPDARGWTPGGLEGGRATGRADNPEGLEGRGDKPDISGAMDKQTKLCAGATENTTKKRLEVRD